MAEIIELDEFKILKKMDGMLKQHPNQIVNPDEEEMKRIDQMLVGVKIDDESFRDFIRNTLPVIKYPPVKKGDKDVGK